MAVRKACSSLACLVIAASVVACAPETPEETGEHQENLKRALPSAQDITIALPGGATVALSDDGLGTAQQALVGETAALYQVTRDITNGVNGAAYVWLSIIEDIANQPPTSVDNGVATWGPHTPALSLLTYVFVLSEDSNGIYHYALEAKVKNQPDTSYLPLITGATTPGDALPDHGWLAIDFDNARTLDPTHPEEGTVAFHYADVGTQLKLDVVFEDFVGEDGEGPHDALYHYREYADHSGDFVFLAESDIDEDGSALETWNIRTRWLSGGSGRSDVTIVGGDLGDAAVNASECWDELFQRTYWAVDPAYLDPAEGDSAACVFAPAVD